MRDTLRYIFFLPAAFLASIIFGAIGNWLGNFGIWIYEGSEAFGWLLSGGASGLMLLGVGMKIAPYKTNKIKWVLLSFLFFLGAVSALGSFFAGRGLAYLAGISMVVVGLLFVKKEPEGMMLGL